MDECILLPVAVLSSFHLGVYPPATYNYQVKGFYQGVEQQSPFHLHPMLQSEYSEWQTYHTGCNCCMIFVGDTSRTLAAS